MDDYVIGYITTDLGVNYSEICTKNSMVYRDILNNNTFVMSQPRGEQKSSRSLSFIKILNNLN